MAASVPDWTSFYADNLIYRAPKFKKDKYN